MNTPTYPDEPKITLEVELSDLRHIIEALLNYQNSQTLDLDGVDENLRMLDLLIQLEQDIVRQLNAQIEEEMQIREFGEL